MCIRDSSGGVEFDPGFGISNYGPTTSVGDATFADLLRRITFNRNKNEELDIVPNANLVQLVKNKEELKKLFIEKGGETFIELPDIDLTDTPINTIGGTSGDTATGVERISSTNFGNSYMTETPELFGFASVIYD